MTAPDGMDPARPDADADSAAPPDDAGPAAEAEWWDDPKMPWRQRPTRADIVCLTALSIAGIYGLIMLPLRPVILGLAPHLLGSLGYRTGIIMTGALAAVGDQRWPIVLVLGSLMTIKFHWIYWWAGRLWGRSILDTFAQNKSARTQRTYERLWGFAHRYEIPVLAVTFLPIPIPAAVVFAALGAAGTSLRKFLIVCGISSLVSTAGYLYLGYRIGEPAVALMELYGRYLWYISIALLVGVIVVAVRRSKPAAG